MPNRGLVVPGRSSQLVVLVLACLIITPLGATPPSPVVSSLFVAIEDDVIEPGTTNVLILPVFLRNLHFGAENTNFARLQSVDASFEG